MANLRGRTPHALCLLALACGVAAAFHEILAPSRGLFFRDHAAVFRPWWWFAVDSLRNGRLPALTHASPSGVPLELTFSAIYTPLTLILFGGDFEAAYDFFVVAHFVVLAIGTYGFAVSLGAAPHEALGAAAVMTLGGPILSFENLLGALPGIAFAPWVYWALARVLRDGSIQSSALLAIALGFHGQGSMPELLLLDVSVATLLLLRSRSTLTAGRCAVVAAGIGLGLSIASIKIGPILEILSETRRGRGFGGAGAETWPFRLSQIVEFVAPSFWSPPNAPFIYPPDLLGSREQTGSYLTTLYLGCASSIGLASLLDPFRRREKVLLVLGSVLVLFMAVGGHGYDLLRSLPLFSSTRYPIKLALLIVPCLSTLVALSLRTVQNLSGALFVVLGLHAATVCGMLVAIEDIEFRRFLEAFLSVRPSGFIGVTPDRYPEIALELMRPRLVHALVFVVIGSIGALILSRGSRPTSLRILVPALILADLASAARFSVIGAEADVGPPEDLIAQIQSSQQRVYVVAPDGQQAPIPHAPGRTFFEERVRSEHLRGHMLYKQVRPYEQLDRDGLSNPAAVKAFHALQTLKGSNALEALARFGVSHVLSWRPIDAPGSMPIEVPGERPEFLVPVPDVRPYLKAYTRWAPIEIAGASHAEIGRWIASAWNRDLAFVAAGSPATATTNANTEAASACAPRLEISSASESRVTAELDSPCAVVVVLLENLMPGWRARVDDQENTIFEAELGFMGQLVPAGRHVVVFEYEPHTKTWAIPSSFAFLLALALVLGPAFVPRLSRGTPPRPARRDGAST